MCNILLQSVQIRQPWMRFQGSSPVLSTPDIILIWTKAAAGRSRQEKENEIVFAIEHLDKKNWWYAGRGYCLSYYLEIQGGSISGYDGPKWHLCAALLTANASYDWFKERIKVLVFSDSSIGWPPRFRISYSQVNFSVSGKWILPISCCGSENEKTLTSS